MSYYIPKQIKDFDENTLNIEETIKVNCLQLGCQDRLAPALSITRVEDGVIYYCYRCNVKGKRIIGHTPNSVSNYIKNRKEIRSINNKRKVTLPADFTPLAHNFNTIPAKAYAWLYQYELDQADLYRFNIGYSSKLDGVVFPIYYDYKLIAYQSRYINYSYNKDKRELKYYTESSVKQLYYYIKNNILINNNINNYKLIYLTEDILSSIKLNKLGNCHCIALLSTKVHDNLIPLLKQYKNVKLWLDYNMKFDSIKQVKRLRTLGINISSVITPKDPKAIRFKILKDITKNYGKTN